MKEDKASSAASPARGVGTTTIKTTRKRRKGAEEAEECEIKKSRKSDGTATVSLTAVDRSVEMANSRTKFLERRQPKLDCRFKTFRAVFQASEDTQDGDIAREFLRRHCLMERLLGHKMLRGHLDSYTKLGYTNPHSKAHLLPLSRQMPSNFSLYKKPKTYDRIGARQYGLTVNERLVEVAESIQHLRVLSGQRACTRNFSGLPSAVHSLPAALPSMGCIEGDYVENGEEADSVSSTDKDESESHGGDNEREYDIPVYDRVLCYALYTIQCDLSMAEIKQMENLMSILNGSSPTIKYEEHVRPFAKSILEQYERKRLFFCAGCESGLSEYREMCENETCPLYRSHLKRSKTVQRIEIHLLNMIPQLSDLLENEVSDIIKFHRILHENHGAQTNDRSDIRLFSAYYQSIENENEFRQNQLKILLTVSLDGFVPKRLTRREIWPLYLRVENISQPDADKFTNSILCGVLYTQSKPTQKMLETLFGRLESELKSLHEEPLRIEVNGVLWTVHVSLYRGVADMGAQRALFGLPRWESPHGCSKCLIEGERIGNRRVWVCRDEEISLRRPESFIGEEAFTPVMRMITPEKFVSDALHIVSEGLTKDRLQDLFTGNTRFPSLKLAKDAVDAVKSSFMKISSHTYANAIILSLEDLKTCRARELDEIAFVAFPLTAACELIPSPVAAVSLVGYWICVKIIFESRSLTTARISIAQHMASLTKKLWMAIAPQSFTMKAHWFFDHGMRDELVLSGSMYQWTSAPFEAHHHRLQVKVNQYIRNSPASMIERYLLNKRLKFLFSDRFQSSQNKAVLYLKQKLESKNLNRAPVGISLSENVYIPKGCRVEASEILAEHKEWLEKYGHTAYSRLVLNGKTYSSRTYWRNNLNSRQDLVFLKGSTGSNDIEAFGSVLLFFYNRTSHSVLVFLEEYNHCNPFEHLSEIISQTCHPLKQSAEELISLVIENNAYFFELKESFLSVRPMSFIQNSCVTLDCCSRTYVSKN